MRILSGERDLSLSGLFVTTSQVVNWITVAAASPSPTGFVAAALCVAVFAGTKKKLDIVVPNAGFAPMVSTVDETPEHFDEMFNTNARGTFFNVQEALPLMNDGGFYRPDWIRHLGEGNTQLRGLLSDEGGPALLCADLDKRAQGSKDSGECDQSRVDRDFDHQSSDAFEGSGGRSSRLLHIHYSAWPHRSAGRDRCRRLISGLEREQLHRGH